MKRTAVARALPYIAVTIVGVALLGLASPAAAVILRACCVCDLCDGEVACLAEIAEACEEACVEASGQNSTVCGFQTFNSTCAEVAACAAAPVGAPALGTIGLTAATLFLTGLGALGLWRAARRPRA
jgi:hypothetical protein